MLKSSTLALHPNTSNWVQPVQTRPNEICSMHNSHAILNDCKMMYLKYITSSARVIFVFCYNLKICLVGCYCHVLPEKPLTNFCLLGHDDLFCFRAPSNFPYTSIFHRQVITQRIAYKPYCRDATFLTFLLGVRLFTKH